MLKYKLLQKTLEIISLQISTYGHDHEEMAGTSWSTVRVYSPYGHVKFHWHPRTRTHSS